MATRSLNTVMLIGNLTRDPELRYTPQGTAVCSFGLATNRQWTTDAGEKREEAEFHRIVAWNKLAELCSQLLTKGRKTFVEGRLQTRTWQSQDGTQRTTTEIVIDDMIILDSRRPLGVGEEATTPVVVGETAISEVTPAAAEPSIVTPPVESADTNLSAARQDKKKSAKGDSALDGEKKEEEKPKEEEEVNPDDIPF